MVKKPERRLGYSMNKSKQDIVDETIAYISVHGRATNEQQNSCEYLTSNGIMCAVGRCLIDPENVVFSEGTGGDTGCECIEDLESQLKPEYRGHDIMFWECLQDLHDDKSYWHNNVLIEKGQERVKEIHEHFAKH